MALAEPRLVLKHRSGPWREVDHVHHRAGTVGVNGPDVNRLAGGFAVEGDLNDLVFDVVSIVVHLELIQNVRIERGRRFDPG
jgi:hypothetical protein